ncbi:MAG: hypothetical protein M3Q83_01565 [Pseudomonadota bacterium]|nr:hypothetical protein [Pseudomonadota bacterium]
MPRGLLIIIVLILVLLVGGAVMLARGVKEQPVQTIEVEVSPNATPR